MNYVSWKTSFRCRSSVLRWCSCHYLTLDSKRPSQTVLGSYGSLSSCSFRPRSGSANWPVWSTARSLPAAYRPQLTDRSVDWWAESSASSAAKSALSVTSGCWRGFAFLSDCWCCSVAQAAVVGPRCSVCRPPLSQGSGRPVAWSRSALWCGGASRPLTCGTRRWISWPGSYCVSCGWISISVSVVPLLSAARSSFEGLMVDYIGSFVASLALRRNRSHAFD